jgi:hypothetical protein
MQNPFALSVARQGGVEARQHFDSVADAQKNAAMDPILRSFPPSVAGRDAYAGLFSLNSKSTGDHCRRQLTPCKHDVRFLTIPQPILCGTALLWEMARPTDGP